MLWVLKPIERNSQWVKWLEAFKRRGTHPVALVLPATKENPVEMDSSGSDYVSHFIGNKSLQGNEATDEMHVPGSSYLSHSGSYGMDASGSAHASHTWGGGYEDGHSSQS
jgi:hypothetical protein